jgi:acetyl esterase/lipase
MLIQVGSHEILLSDAIRLAGRAAEADVAIVLEVTPGVPHVFQAFAAVLDEGEAALNRAGEFLKTHFAVTSGTHSDIEGPAANVSQPGRTIADSPQ